MKRRLWLVLAVVGLSAAAGCTDGVPAPPAKAPVSGTVTLDGAPMGGGEVRFNLAGQPPQILAVTGGAFSGEVFVGVNQIDVVWEQDGPPHPMDPTQKLKVNVVDARFLGPASPLQHDVPAAGVTDLKLEVTSAR